MIKSDKVSGKATKLGRRGRPANWRAKSAEVQHVGLVEDSLVPESKETFDSFKKSMISQIDVESKKRKALYSTEIGVYLKSNGNHLTMKDYFKTLSKTFISSGSYSGNVDET
ncbi:MAG: hypothetical protein KDD45_05020 [Bdellovibrionales bacterium]|nr:hypothetical protein [Bdellovibrionales bacterium]